MSANNHIDQIRNITDAVSGAMKAYAARGAIVEDADARAETRLAAAETAATQQSEWAIARVTEVASAASAVSAYDLGEAATAPPPPSQAMPDIDPRAGLMAAVANARAGRAGIEQSSQSLAQWQARRFRILTGIAFAGVVALALIVLVVERTISQAQSRNATATAAAVAVLTADAGRLTARADSATRQAAESEAAALEARQTEEAADSMTRAYEQGATATTAAEQTRTVATALTATTAASLTAMAPPTIPVLPLVASVNLPGGGFVERVFVPAGEFTLGSSPADPEAKADEKPSRRVAMDEFWIDRTEVTNGQFAQFINAVGNLTEGGSPWLDILDAYTLIEQSGGYFPKSGYANHPVVNVSWFGARSYCEWTGGRLPTEAEWEYAARGPGGTIYPWGNSFSCGPANLDDETGRDRTVGPWGVGCDGYAMTAPVGSFPAGASWVGAVDMIGNVYEWVDDWYAADTYAASPVDNPSGPLNGVERVLRGSAWNMEETEAARSAHRLLDAPGNRRDFVGFRCASD